MSAELTNYKTIVDSVFGTGSATFDTARSYSNNVIGALLHKAIYSEFEANFVARLHRLEKAYSSEPTARKAVLEQINCCARETWTGAYPELVAYDYFAQQNDFAYSVPKLHVELPVADTFAQELGMTSVNLDGLYDEFGLFFDVKALKDNIKEILESAYGLAEQELGLKLQIAHEYASDSSYVPFQRNLSDLVSEIVGGVRANSRVEYIKSSVIPNLSFRLAWGGKVLMTESTYSPYRHAEQLHASVFNYASKFTKTKKFVLVVVVFPWSNLTVNEFAGSNKKFYRSLARRVFMQYRSEPTLFKTLNAKFTGSETVHQVSKKLTGILFLEDKCILADDPSAVNAVGYFYANPNADNRLGMFEDYLMHSRLAAFEDFSADNY